MDDSAIRAGKLAGLFLLAAGMSGCVAGPYMGKLGSSDRSGAPTANQCPASVFEASTPQNAAIATAAGKAGSAGTPVLEILEIPIADPLRPSKEVPFELDPVVNEAPGKVFVRSGMNRGDVEKANAADEDVQADDGSADDSPGRAFVCDNAEPEVVYQELAVAVPAERWPGYRSGSGHAGRRRDVVKRHISGHGSSSPGIVRYVDPVQGSVQVVFAGMTLVEPGTRIAVRHQLLFGRLASTEFLEVVNSEPGVAIVRPIGNGRITKTAIGDPVVVVNE